MNILVLVMAVVDEHALHGKSLKMQKVTQVLLHLVMGTATE